MPLPAPPSRSRRSKPLWTSWAMTLRVSLSTPVRTLATASATVLPWQRSTRTRVVWCRGSLPVHRRRSVSRRTGGGILRLFTYVGALAASPSPSSTSLLPSPPSPCSVFFLQVRCCLSKICLTRWSFCIRHSSSLGPPQLGIAHIAASTASLRPFWKNLSLRTRRNHASTWRIRKSCGHTHLSLSRAAACVGGTRGCRSPISWSRWIIMASSGSVPSALFLSHSAKSVGTQGASPAAARMASDWITPRKCSLATRSR
mmetsp:Transcript_103139/g.318243  ORF Transcript_103139/g.318243 Transcript_103139/m.318243 type:complete len:257 (-) Transcript_103139:84-854(-)